MTGEMPFQDPKSMSQPDQTTHFGFRDVPLGEKQTMVNEVFTASPRAMI
jgi:hypothetical protein